MAILRKLIFNFCFTVIILLLSSYFYLQYQVVELSSFPQINQRLTSDLWKEKYLFKDVKLVIDNHENTSQVILDNDGLLNVTGWTYANKLNAKKKRVSPVLYGYKKLSYARFKHIDFFNFDVEEYSLRITGYATGLHKYLLGAYNLEFFNWKTKEYIQHSSWITPFDTYAFRDNTVNFYKIHYKRNGLETTVVRGKDNSEWLLTIKVKLQNPKQDVDVTIAENPGLSSVDSFDGENKAYWLRRYGNANCFIREGLWRLGKRPKRVTKSQEYQSEDLRPSMYHWQIKGMFPYKPFAYLRAHLQTKNQDMDEEEEKKMQHLIHFTYAIEGNTRENSEDLTQFIAIGSRVYKLEPVLHDLERPDMPLTKEVKFYTKDEGLYDERKVNLIFTPYFNAPKSDIGNMLMYTKGYLVYGKWNGYIVDNKGKKFRVENGKGTITYGTTKF